MKQQPPFQTAPPSSARQPQPEGSAPNGQAEQLGLALLGLTPPPQKPGFTLNHKKQVKQTFTQAAHTSLPVQGLSSLKLPSGFKANVVPFCETGHSRVEPYTYQVPPFLEPDIQVGTWCLVPFGRQGWVPGLVLEVLPPEGSDTKATSGKPRPLKPVVDVLDLPPLAENPSYLKWLNWLANEYGASLAQVWQCAVPAKLLKQPLRRWQLRASRANTSNPWPINSPPLAQLLALLAPKSKAKQAGQGLSTQALQQHLAWPPEVLQATLQQARSEGFIERTPFTPVKAPKPPWVLQWQAPSQENQLEAIKLTASQQELWQQLSSLLAPGGTAAAAAVKQPHKTLALKEVKTQLNVSSDRLKRLAAKLSPYLTIKEAGSEPLEAPLALTEEQRPVFEALHQACLTLQSSSVAAQATPKTQLLQGVTGSGKTEVYLQLAQAVLNQGGQVLVLVPEIALSGPIAERFKRRFGPQVQVWHSQQSDGEKAYCWQQVQAEAPALVVGARSAAFLPFKRLQLIIIDECHDGSYKQEAPAPRYDAIHCLQARAEQSQALLLLGSATPLISQRYQAEQGHWPLHTLSQRATGACLPKVQTVDLRQYDRKALLAPPLLEAIEQTLRRGEQVILLINRRGFHTAIQCEACGTLAQCPNCSVRLTLHQSADAHTGELKSTVCCHHCGYQAPPPTVCHHCLSPRLHRLGSGTQRLESQLAGALQSSLAQWRPQQPLKILRLDRDVTKHKQGAAQVLTAFSQGEADILLGTQLVAKGLDIPNVTLVGVLQVDQAFSMPDYLAVERGYQLLTQVAGRAGRAQQPGQAPGQVLLQTWQPEQGVLQLVKRQAYEQLYTQELHLRHLLGFPPFKRLLRFVVSGEDLDTTAHYASLLQKSLALALEQEPLPLGSQAYELVGPAPCLLERVQQRYRYQFLLKFAPQHQAVHQAAIAYYRQLRLPKGLRCLLDVDAQSLL